ncbi:MAG: acylphosphatase [Hyphomicrobiales bacterium]
MIRDTQPLMMNRQTELFRFSGDVSDPGFLDWICHRANQLGLSGWVREDVSGNCIEALASGPEELLDAMELGCSLGPITVWVETVERFPHDSDAPIPNGFKILTQMD